MPAPTVPAEEAAPEPPPQSEGIDGASVQVSDSEDSANDREASEGNGPEGEEGAEEDGGEASPLVDGAPKAKGKLREGR